MKYLSLFSGIGGFELGIIKAYENMDNRGIASPSKLAVHGNKSHTDPSDGNGWGTNPLCIGYSEIDKYAIKIYQKHFPEHKNYGDITKINVQELPDFDLLVGGFPCQAFSIAGKRKGFDDTRGTLFFDIARILKEKRPRNFILENVKGLLSHDGGRTFKTIISTLTELGYCVEWQVLNAKNFGVPQNRERVFIVGHFGGIPERKVFPIAGQSNENSTISQSAETAVARTLTGGGHTGGNHSGMTILKDEVSIRRLTPLECERLMGYPDNWTEGLSDTQRYKTLGNGVVSNVVEEVVKKLSTGRACTSNNNNIG